MSAHRANSPGWNAALMQVCCFWRHFAQSQVTHLSTELPYSLQTHKVSCWSPSTVYKVLHDDCKRAHNPRWKTLLDMQEGDIVAFNFEIRLRSNLKPSCGLVQGSQPRLTPRLASEFRLCSVGSLVSQLQDLNTTQSSGSLAEILSTSMVYVYRDAEETPFGTWTPVWLTRRTSLFCFQSTVILQGQDKDTLALTVDPPHRDGSVRMMRTVGYYHGAALPSLLGQNRTAALRGRALPLQPHHHPLLLQGTSSSWYMRQEITGPRSITAAGDKRFSAPSILLLPLIPSPATFVRPTVFHCAPPPLTLLCCSIFMDTHL